MEQGDFEVVMEDDSTADENKVDEKARILDQLNAKNTKLATKQAVDNFRAWLLGKNLETSFELMSKESLDDLLSDYWLEARTKKNELYKSNSLKNIRYSIQRHLEEKCQTPINIIQDTEFSNSNRSFKAMLKEFKRVGKGATKHHNPITKTDLQKIYKKLSTDIDSNPTSLQQKVLFDIILHFGRRGRENLRDLTKEHFNVLTDSSGKR